jgi:hypothetical protein
VFDTALSLSPSQLAGLARSLQRSGFIKVLKASRPIMATKNTTDSRRKKVPRSSAIMMTHLLVSQAKT